MHRGTTTILDFQSNFSSNATDSIKENKNTSTIFSYANKDTSSVEAFTAQILTRLESSSSSTLNVIDFQTYRTQSLKTVTPKENLVCQLALSNSVPIHDYLEKNSELVSILNQIYNSLVDKGYASQTTLEHFKDIEEGWEKLFILIDTQIENEQEIVAIEQRLYEQLLQSLNQFTRNKLVLSVS